MEIAHHVANHFGGFLEGLPGIQPQQAHPVENAAMHRLKAIARIRQRPIHDGGQGVGEVALFQSVAQPNLFDRAFVRGNQSLAHPK